MKNVPTVQFAAGEVIFKENDTSNSVYLIISGKVEISRQQNHKKIILATQGENTLFGEMALIDGKSRSATVTALERTFCYKCSAVSILNELKKIDSEVYRVLQHIAAIIRENNDTILKNTKESRFTNRRDVIFDEDVKRPYITKEEITNNQILQAKIEKLSPFIKSMYRVLMQIAYK